MRETIPIANGEAKKAKRQADPELLALSRLERILGGLPDDARLRAVRWLASKYDRPAIDRSGTARPQPGA